jgi:hypothetical protein
VHCLSLSSSSTIRSTALGCVNKHCSSLSEETSLSDVPSLLAEEEGEEGLDIFVLERAPPKTSFCDRALSMAFALVSMARVAVQWQMVDESISMERLAVLADRRCSKKCEMREHGNSSSAVFLESPVLITARSASCASGVSVEEWAPAPGKIKRKEKPYNWLIVVSYLIGQCG